MNSGKLATHVHVNRGDGRTDVFGPGDSVPAWAREKITHPQAWVEAPTKRRRKDERQEE